MYLCLFVCLFLFVCLYVCLFLRRTELNYCFVLETEEPLVTQCGDDFIVREQCLDCGCCYDDVRQPPCYQSFGKQ